MKIAVISGSRADRGGLTAVVNKLDKSHDVWDLSVDDLPRVISEKPDLAVVLGDRFEILRVAVELYISGIPIFHLSGGDVTQGSADDSMRHAITKLSSIHFVTNEKSAQRVIQLGEEPWRVYNVGYPGEDNIETGDFEYAKNFAGITSFPTGFLLVIWHPNTIDTEDNLLDVVNLISALDRIFQKTLVIGPNKDFGNKIVREQLGGWCTRTYNRYVDELPRHIYLTLLKHCGCLVGNSSSGYYEAPILGTPVVDIGDRQLGRSRPECMLSVPSKVQDIVLAIQYQMKCGRCYPPRSGSDAASRIAEVISNIKDPKTLLRKKFHDLQGVTGKGLG